MNEQKKGIFSRAARIVPWVAVPAAVLALVFGTLYLWGEAKATRASSGLKINHKLHTETVGLSCDICHEANSSNPRLIGFPDHDTCIACHADALDASSSQKDCELCHTRADYKTQVRLDPSLSPVVVFDHQNHQKAGADCAVCHAVFDKDVLAGDEMLPSMDTCVKCHTDQKVKGGTDCFVCHVKGLEQVRPLTHTAAWTRAHGAGLTTDQIDSNCDVCHTKKLGTSCATCHHQAPLNFGKSVSCSQCHGEGFEKTRPADHTPLWVSSHGKGLTQSRIDQACSLCHTPANGNDCQSCHRREAPKDHTIGWSLNLHGTAARSGRQSCSTCHDQSECISCHTTNAPFTHTGSWGTPNDRHCLSCHTDGGSYVGGALGSNCSVCHSSAAVFGKHTSQSLPAAAPPKVPAHNTSMNCRVCHNVASVRHPIPSSAATCVSCHH